jgi:hypothetical protein
VGDTETMTRKNKGDMIWDDDIGDVVENCYLDPKGWLKKKTHTSPRRDKGINRNYLVSV